MEGFDKLFTDLNERVRKLERQMGFLIDRFNNLENKVQEHSWQITAIQPDINEFVK
jgi:uncharacterized coiled-coil protein SlyX